MRGEQSEASLEDFRRTGGSFARQDGGGDSALRRPTGMQELGLRPIHPTLQQAGGKASADARRLRHAVRVETQQLGCEVSNAEGCEEPRWMEAALVKLAGRDAADTAGDLVT